MNSITPILTGHPLPAAPRPSDVLEPNIFFEPAVMEPALAHLASDTMTLVAGVPVHRGTARYGPLSPSGPLTVWNHPYFMVGVPPLERDDPTAGLDRLAGAIMAAFRGRSVLSMNRMRTDGPAWQVLCEWLEATGRRYHVIQRYDRAGHRFTAGDTTGLDDLRSKKSASSMRSKRRKLEKLGTMEFITATHGDALRHAADHFLDLEASGWKGKAGTALKTAGHGPFVHAMVQRLSEAGRVRIDIRTLDGTPIAGTLFLRDGTDEQPIWMPWKIAYDERYAAHAAGAVTLYDVTERLMAEARDKGTAIAFDSVTEPGSVIFNRLWPKQRWHLADLLIDLQPGGSTAYRPLLLAEQARLRARSTAKRARDMARAALRKRR